MQLEVGMILEGKISGITSFGAFVDLPEDKSGLVHISEVSSTYVENINDHLKKGQIVKVKVLSISDNGKISLSIKRAEPKKQEDKKSNQKKQNNQQKSLRTGPGNCEWQKPRSSEPISFEDMMLKFKQSSDERMSGLNRNEPASHRPRRNSKLR